MRQVESHVIESSAKESQVANDGPTVPTLRDKPGVLVVDDDHMVRSMVQLGLERHGFNVWLASSGHQALQIYGMHRKSIGVVLLDVHMPDLDGLATLRALHKLNPEIPACFMSGDTDCQGREELRRRGAAQVIAKPFLLNELASTLRLLTHGVTAQPAEEAATVKRQGAPRAHRRHEL
jgi:CheY-like chemotaxis protein